MTTPYREIIVLAIEMVPGWYALAAGSGTEAITVAGRERPDAILLDVRMPGMDGPEVVSRLRAGSETREVPVILLSASDRSDEVARLRALPVSGIVRKPFSPGSFPGVICRLLGWAGP
jgi:CheY-like chemotaxis protein